MLNDDKLRQCLMDIRAIGRPFDPRPFARADVQSLSDHGRSASRLAAGVNAFGVHLCHPAEITGEFVEAVR